MPKYIHDGNIINNTADLDKKIGQWFQSFIKELNIDNPAALPLNKKYQLIEAVKNDFVEAIDREFSGNEKLDQKTKDELKKHLNEKCKEEEVKLFGNDWVIDKVADVEEKTQRIFAEFKEDVQKKGELTFQEQYQLNVNLAADLDLLKRQLNGSNLPFKDKSSQTSQITRLYEKNAKEILGFYGKAPHLKAFEKLPPEQKEALFTEVSTLFDTKIQSAAINKDLQFNELVSITSSIYEDVLSPVVLQIQQRDQKKNNKGQVIVGQGKGTPEMLAEGICEALLMDKLGTVLSPNLTGFAKKYPDLAKDIEDLYKRYPQEVEQQLAEITGHFNKFKNTELAMDKQLKGEKGWTPDFAIQLQASGKTHTFFLDGQRNQIDELSSITDQEAKDRLFRLLEKMAIKETQAIVGYCNKKEDVISYNDVVRFAKKEVGRDKDANKVIDYNALAVDKKVEINKKFNEALRKFEESFDNDASLTSEQRDKLKEGAKQFITEQQEEYTGVSIENTKVATVALAIAKSSLKKDSKGNEVPIPQEHFDAVQNVLVKLPHDKQEQFVAAYNKNPKDFDKMLPKSSNIAENPEKLAYLKNLIENPIEHQEVFEKVKNELEAPSLGKSILQLFVSETKFTVNQNFVETFNERYKKEYPTKPKESLNREDEDGVKIESLGNSQQTTRPISANAPLNNNFFRVETPNIVPSAPPIASQSFNFQTKEKPVERWADKNGTKGQGRDANDLEVENLDPNPVSPPKSKSATQYGPLPGAQVQSPDTSSSTPPRYNAPRRPEGTEAPQRTGNTVYVSMPIKNANPSPKSLIDETAIVPPIALSASVKPSQASSVVINSSITADLNLGQAPFNPTSSAQEEESITPVTPPTLASRRSKNLSIETSKSAPVIAIPSSDLSKTPDSTTSSPDEFYSAKAMDNSPVDGPKPIILPEEQSIIDAYKTFKDDKQTPPTDLSQVIITIDEGTSIPSVASSPSIATTVTVSPEEQFIINAYKLFKDDKVSLADDAIKGLVENQKLVERNKDELNNQIKSALQKDSTLELKDVDNFINKVQAAVNAEKNALANKNKEKVTKNNKVSNEIPAVPSRSPKVTFAPKVKVDEFSSFTQEKEKNNANIGNVPSKVSRASRIASYIKSIFSSGKTNDQVESNKSETTATSVQPIITSPLIGANRQSISQEPLDPSQLRIDIVETAPPVGRSTFNLFDSPTASPRSPLSNEENPYVNVTDSRFRYRVLGIPPISLYSSLFPLTPTSRRLSFSTEDNTDFSLIDFNLGSQASSSLSAVYSSTPLIDKDYVSIDIQPTPSASPRSSISSPAYSPVLSSTPTLSSISIIGDNNERSVDVPLAPPLSPLTPTTPIIPISPLASSQDIPLAPAMTPNLSFVPAPKPANPVLSATHTKQMNIEKEKSNQDVPSFAAAPKPANPVLSATPVKYEDLIGKNNEQTSTSLSTNPAQATMPNMMPQAGYYPPMQSYLPMMQQRPLPNPLNKEQESKSSNNLMLGALMMLGILMGGFIGLVVLIASAATLINNVKNGSPESQQDIPQADKTPSIPNVNQGQAIGQAYTPQYVPMPQFYSPTPTPVAQPPSLSPQIPSGDTSFAAKENARRNQADLNPGGRP